jgi:RNA polymerase sigma factor (sigma-70 family)
MHPKVSIHPLRAALLALRTDVAARLIQRSRRRRPGEVEEKVQETMVRAFGSLHTFDPDKGDLSKWVCGIADHVDSDEIALRQRHAALFCADLDDAEHTPALDISPEEAYRQREARAILADAAEEMPEPYLTMLAMVGCEGYSPAAAAGALGIQQETARSRLSKARRFLYEKLGALMDELRAALPPAFFAAIRDDTLAQPLPPLGKLYDTAIRGGLVCSAFIAALFVIPADPPGVADVGRHVVALAEMSSLRLPASAVPGLGPSTSPTPALLPPRRAPSRSDAPRHPPRVSKGVASKYGLDPDDLNPP